MTTLKKIIYSNYPALSLKTAEQIASIISAKPDALLCFPAGETSVGTFEELIKLNEEGRLSFKQSRIVGLDEWMNLGEMQSENCFSFLKKHLFDHIDYSVENLCFFDGESPEPEKECIKTDNFIKKYGPIDMILLGVGMNGHLGLNEPGNSPDLYSHIVDLDETTKNVCQKYFSREVQLSSGITLGMKHIMESKTVIMQLNGFRKAEIARRLIESEISPAFPASMVKAHINSYLILDREAAEYL